MKNDSVTNGHGGKDSSPEDSLKCESNSTNPGNSSGGVGGGGNSNRPSVDAEAVNRIVSALLANGTLPNVSSTTSSSAATTATAAAASVNNSTSANDNSAADASALEAVSGVPNGNVGADPNATEQLLSAAVKAILQSDELFGQLQRERLSLRGGIDVDRTTTTTTDLPRRSHRSAATTTTSSTHKSNAGDAGAGAGATAMSSGGGMVAGTGAGPSGTPPVKSVSFSSISAPLDDDFDDTETDTDAITETEDQYSAGAAGAATSNGTLKKDDDDDDDEDWGSASSPFHTTRSEDEYERSRYRRRQERRQRKKKTGTTAIADSGSGPPPPPSSSADGNQYRTSRSMSPSILRNRIGAGGRAMLAHSNSESGLQPSLSMPLSGTSGASASLSYHSAASGEATASGDSSVASGQGTPLATGGTAQPHHHVHFSAINPNPQLVLGGGGGGDAGVGVSVASAASSGGGVAQEGSVRISTNSATYNQQDAAASSSGIALAESASTGQQRGQQQQQQQASAGVVRFHADRSVSFEDDAIEGGSSSGHRRTSRSSGYSSPTIDPALSPPRSRSRSPGPRIHFAAAVEDADTHTMNTITQAAARLQVGSRSEGGEGAVAAGGGEPRVVHFSAMRDVTVIRNPRDDAASSLFQPIARGGAVRNDDQAATTSAQAQQQSSSSSHPAVHFADDTDDGGRNEDQDSAARGIRRSSTESEMVAVAERLRRLIRRAEEVDHVTLEAAFEHFDQDHSGDITPDDLQRGLRSLGSTFKFSLEECRALLDTLAGQYAHHHHHSANVSDANNDEPRVTLLGFYRAMGRHSPPPSGSLNDDDEVEDDDEDAVEEANGATGTDGGATTGGGAAATFRRSSSSSLLRQRLVAAGTDPSAALASSSVIHAQDAANRLRRMVWDAEQNEGVSLETFFNLLDINRTGRISPADFRRGLQELGRQGTTTITQDSSADAGNNGGGGGVGENDGEPGDVEQEEPAFASISEQDCEQLVALFDTNHDGLVSLLDFYRFMGQPSPPLSRTASEDLSAANILD